MTKNLQVFDFSDYRLMTIKSSILAECIESFKAGECDGFLISREHGFDLDSIEFLEELTEMRGLRVMDDVDLVSFDSIKNLTNLEYLNFRAKRQKLDLRNLLNLKNLEIEYLNERISLPEFFPKLEVLLLGPFNPKSKDLGGLTAFKRINTLHIVQSNIASLKGLDYFDNLKEIYFSYLIKLEDISEFNLKNIESILFDGCKKVGNFNELSRFKHLKKLEIINCGTIPNISFVNEISNLKCFNFVNTNVLDGDLSPCLRLNYARTLDKKHYSHRSDQLPRSITL